MQQYADTDSPTETTSATACPGKCNSAWRAAEHRYETTAVDHDLEPRDGQPVWCPPCTTAIRSAIAEWPDLALRLAEEVESGVSAGMSEYVSGSKNKPVHDHEAASFLLDEYAEWIGEWEATLRVERRLAKRKTANSPRDAIGNATRFLLVHLDWHLGHTADGRFHDIPAAQIIEEWGLEILRYHRRAQILTGTRDVEPVRIAGVECKNCKYKALEHEVEGASAKQAHVTRFVYADDGEILIQRDGDARPVKATETALASMQGAALGYIRCRRCKPTFRMTLDEYHKWVRMLAAGEETRALASREKLADIFGNSVPKQYQAKR